MEDRTKRRARLFTVVGFVIAAVGGGATYLYASTAAPTQQAPVEEKGEVVVAARDLPARTSITPSDVTIAQMPRALIPVTAITKTDDVKDKILTVPVARGEFITPTKFQAVGQAPFTVLPTGVTFDANLPPYRAMSINIPDTNAVGGNIQAGDMVDIIATFNVDPNKFFNPAPPAPADPRRVADFFSRIIMANVPVLAKIGSVYTIRVQDLALAERLAYMQASGVTLMMLLRAPRDERPTNTTGANFPSIYQGFGVQITTRINP